MFESLIIFYTANYCQKIKSFFDVDTLISYGVNIEYWDLSELTTHEYLSPVYSADLVIKKFLTLESLENEISNRISEKILYMSFVDYAIYSYRIYRLLSKYKSNILFSTTGIVPIKEENLISKFKKIKSLNLFYRILQNQLIKISLKTPLIRPAKFVLISCNEAFCNYKSSKKTIYLACSSGDYNNFRYCTNLSKNNSNDIIVFIDQYLPFHNDFIINGHKNIDPIRYYRSLNLFFDLIEKKYNCKVVICAHPSATMYRENNFFNNRSIIYNRIAESVQESLGVIAHFSTAISYPVMSSKPLIIITSDQLESMYPSLSKTAYIYKDILKVPIINIDYANDVAFEKVNNNAYSEYLFKYLTTPLSYKNRNACIIKAIIENKYEKFEILV